MMNEMLFGVTGAKRQTVKRSSPRHLLGRILAATRERDEKKVLKAFRKALSDDPDYNDQLAAIIEYWFANNFRSLIREEISPSDQGRYRRRVQADVTERLQESLSSRAQKLLLEMMLPNGKELRDCTGRECKFYGPKVGKLLTSLGKTLDEDQKVGDVYKTNAQLKKFFF